MSSQSEYNKIYPSVASELLRYLRRNRITDHDSEYISGHIDFFDFHYDYNWQICKEDGYDSVIITDLTQLLEKNQWMVEALYFDPDWDLKLYFRVKKTVSKYSDDCVIL
jgi:hypothetical protein